MQKQTRNFFWPITDRSVQDQLDLFIKLSIVRGVHHSTVLGELVRDYNTRFLADNPAIARLSLIDEKGLVADLKRKGKTISRITLVKHRASKDFAAGQVPLFWTDGKRIVYNLDGCREFFGLKKAA